jgi:hypothetical protein
MRCDVARRYPQAVSSVVLYLDEQLAPGEATPRDRETARGGTRCAPGEPLYARVDPPAARCRAGQSRRLPRDGDEVLIAAISDFVRLTSLR